MRTAKKNTSKRISSKKTSAVTVVVKKRIAAKDTLFPEKLAKAKEILGKTENL